MSNIRQREDGKWEQAVRLFPGGRIYVAVTESKPRPFGQLETEALTAFAEQCARTAQGFRRMAEAVSTWRRDPTH